MPFERTYVKGASDNGAAHWVNTANAYDGNDGTCATVDESYAGERLEITGQAGQRYGTHIRVMVANNGGDVSECMVEVYWNSEWHTLHEGSLTGMVWHEFSVGSSMPVDIEKIGISYGGAGYNFQFYEAQFHAIWVSPVGYEDGTNWSNIANMYDDDIENYGGIGFNDPYPVTLLAPAAFTSDSEAMRIYCEDNYAEGDGPDVKIEIYDGLSWTEIWDGVLSENVWVKITFTAQTVTKIRLTNQVMNQNLRIYEVDFCGQDPETFSKGLDKGVLRGVVRGVVR